MKELQQYFVFEFELRPWLSVALQILDNNDVDQSRQSFFLFFLFLLLLFFFLIPPAVTNEISMTQVLNFATVHMRQTYFFSTDLSSLDAVL